MPRSYARRVQAWTGLPTYIYVYVYVQAHPSAGLNTPSASALCIQRPPACMPLNREDGCCVVLRYGYRPPGSKHAYSREEKKRRQEGRQYLFRLSSGLRRFIRTTVRVSNWVCYRFLPRLLRGEALWRAKVAARISRAPN
jgi:hypothetical protein